MLKFIQSNYIKKVRLSNLFKMSSENLEKKQKEPCSWVKYSESKLIDLEKRIFGIVKTTYNGWFVEIDHKCTKKAKIWTISMNTESTNTPLVLLHGFGASVGFWCMNLDSLAANRPVYAIDILGFGRSSRAPFGSGSVEAEKGFVESIEKWRKEVKLDKFILLGHSMGGFLATSYTMTHPQHVKHLILADPWGFVSKSDDSKVKTRPLLVTVMLKVFYPFTAFNPLATVRAAGPLGPWMVRKARADIARAYAKAFEDYEIISEYIYQCNSQTPTGETAFHNMISGFGWAKHPMLKRIDELDSSVPITMLYGEKSWLDNTIGDRMIELRPDSYVKLEMIKDAGHHIFADNADMFNDVVVNICDKDEAESHALPEESGEPVKHLTDAEIVFN